MKFHLRQYPFRNGKYSGIGYDQRIGSDVPQLLKVFLHPGQIAVVGQDIGGDIDLHAPLMGKLDPLLHLLVRKIVRLGPQAECLSSDIDSVRAVDYSGL